MNAGSELAVTVRVAAFEVAVARPLETMQRNCLPLSAVQAPLALAEGRGLIERDAAGTLVRPTARGFDFLSDLQSLFLPPAAKDRGQTMTAGAFPAAVRPLVP